MQQQQDSNQLQPGSGGLSYYDRYAPIIFAYLQLQTHSREEAEDLTLEVFTAALESNNLSGLADTEKLAWLRRVAKNKLVDYYRRSNRRPAVGLDQVELLYNDESLSPEQVVLRQEKHSQLRAAVNGLPLFQQQVLWLRYGEGLRCAEIGVLLNKREEAVRKLLSRSLIALRTFYRQQQGGNE